MRLRGVALTAALAMSSVSNAQEKKAVAPPPPKLAGKAEERTLQLRAMEADFIKVRREAVIALRSAQSESERQAALAKMPKEADFLPRVHILIANGAKDDVAADALSFAVFSINTRDPEVFEALSRDFVKSDKIKRFLQMASTGAPDQAKPVLEKVASENPSRDMKGLAHYALGNLAFEKDSDAARKEAEAHFARVKKDYADINVGRRKLGDLAERSLFELRHLQVGMVAPPAESKDLKGNKVTLAALKGKVVVLDIWATWCGPCRAMIPHERTLVEKFKDKPFELVSISADDDRKELDAFLEKEPMPWTHWWDGAEGTLLKAWNVRYFPTVYVIDQKGVIRHKNLRDDKLEAAIAALLAEK